MLLLDRGGKDKIAEEAINPTTRWNKREMIAFLLDRGGENNKITNEVIEAA